MRVLLFLFIAGLACCSRPAVNQEIPVNDLIRTNQVGYYPSAVKEFVVADIEATTFELINESGEAVYQGTLSGKGTWEASGEKVLVGDFTGLEAEGTYTIILNTGDRTAPFMIGKNAFSEAFGASIKSYYFQRASMAIEEAFGGDYSREAGHPDLACPFHPSSGRKEGALDSPGGWYDAGDYGKYVVNAALSVGQMLSLAELFPGAVADGRLNIPESGNGVSDLLDEIRYELEWVATMQDTDGGVFHKLTAMNFAGFIMPSDYDLERLVIGKGTCASLSFAAVMAQASRVYRGTDSAWAGQLLTAAEKAWQWSVEHPDLPYRNPPEVRTGEYGDDAFSDDFYWAAAELYLTTGGEAYLKYLLRHEEPYIHQQTNSWKFFVRNNGFHTLLVNHEGIKPALAASLTAKHLALSDGILKKMLSVPYLVGVDHFEWGSNSDVLNQAMILCIAHQISGERKYLDGAVRSMDYIFGKNATGYCFLTGYGTKQVMNPHHRPSGADGIVAPVPGFILGGPNNDRQDRQSVQYASEYPAKAYADTLASFASNEVCLNWNAPAVFVLGYLEQAYH